MKPVRRDLARQKPARRPIISVALACAGLAATLVLSSCSGGGGNGSGSGSGSGNPDGPRVAAAFYPLAFVADRVAGDQAEVTNLTKPGVEPHDLEPSVRQMVSLASADLVLVLKGFQPPIDTAVEQNASGVVLDAAQVVDLEASSGRADPHFWLDPVRLGKLAEAVADQLAAIDPGEASGYHSRATALVAELDELDRS
ncbi:MAG: metal ABC transporter substrate-binding protein, partial [Nocardioides sp.]